MSDFDKEAEREKLREKYERDKEERKATQRMSDLLLKGATMTNAHCGTCGDPLFQMDGTTFCPSCHGNPDAVEGTDLEAQSAEESDADGEPDEGAAPKRGERSDDSTPETAEQGADRSASEIDVEPSTDVASTAGQQRDEGDAGQRADARASRDDRQRRSATARTERSAEPSSDSETSGSAVDDRTDGADASRSASTPRAPAVEGDLETARDALVRALEKFAEEAAATDDPRYARECLEAAREAGETLSTLR